MTETPTSAAQPGWRLISRADTPFVYELVTLVDPRWWRFSRKGLEPSILLENAQSVAAGVIIHNETGRPVACGVLTDAGASTTGTLEYFARPDERSLSLARQFAPEIIRAAFTGSPIRRLYHERFEGDPDVLGEMADLFEVEVTYPSFALVAGQLEQRTVSVLTRERFSEWAAISTGEAHP